ncbi:sodium-dependent bicarbonate transport family permease [Anaerobacillus isosaccharinicus]|uniref:Sodium-dependent bicarbonate transport family permease n=1 Tax=Anaerobacillus isosaccharinicus TaxID=1532552 RepID=A0A7S7L750_9BACI|nr:sodium-dependent bicarbonate transport family permease [Anaerobacillus isosaccharinicus]MBA5586031.1 sodium-dependent bicarbonate transport family permease [Anaerobacillus isosaccharinicus]QOY35693.1 sodium-dependent bicarbonate transport family permease [Anaerobacillus isosaccharinicus]
MLDMVIQNLLSPAILFFILGIIAAIVSSDFDLPKGLGEGLSAYLLIAIGLKGGIELSNYSLAAVSKPILGTIILGTIIPIITLYVLRHFLKMDLKNSIGLAATYGSVSIVTYGAAINFLDNLAISYESFMNAMVVVMEIPGILVALLLLGIIEKKGSTSPASPLRNVGIVAQNPFSFINVEVLKESFFGKSILLLVGSLLIGLIVGTNGLPIIKPLFIDLYQSVLILFLLNMGLMAGKRLAVIRRHGLKLLAFGLFMPIFYGTLGALVGVTVGLSLGGATLMGVLAASASYIAAPAALRTSVPEADPSIYLGLALGVTFPLNLTIGIPLYYTIAGWLL